MSRWAAPPLGEGVYFKVVMFMSRAKQPGFTIVELLIVIVVIGILATVTVVAYNGVQQRANNAKTTQALGAWIKALNLYKIDNGGWPHYTVCLGEGYKYGVSGDDSSGTAQCRQSGTGVYVENSSFNTAMKLYTGGSLPTPAFITARSTDTEWRRGLEYHYGGGTGTQVYIATAFAGQFDSCPVVSGVSGSLNIWGSNTYCSYLIGATTDT